jgi:hypothetical protein
LPQAGVLAAGEAADADAAAAQEIGAAGPAPVAAELGHPVEAAPAAVAAVLQPSAAAQEPVAAEVSAGEAEAVAAGDALAAPEPLAAIAAESGAEPPEAVAAGHGLAVPEPLAVAPEPIAVETRLPEAVAAQHDLAAPEPLPASPEPIAAEVDPGAPEAVAAGDGLAAAEHAPAEVAEPAGAHAVARQRQRYKAFGRKVGEKKRRVKRLRAAIRHAAGGAQATTEDVVHVVCDALRQEARGPVMEELMRRRGRENDVDWSRIGKAAAHTCKAWARVTHVPMLVMAWAMRDCGMKRCDERLGRFRVSLPIWRRSALPRALPRRSPRSSNGRLGSCGAVNGMVGGDLPC